MQASTPEFKAYQEQVLRNSSRFAEVLPVMCLIKNHKYTIVLSFRRRKTTFFPAVLVVIYICRQWLAVVQVQLVVFNWEVWFHRYLFSLDRSMQNVVWLFPHFVPCASYVLRHWREEDTSLFQEVLATILYSLTWKTRYAAQLFHLLDTISSCSTMYTVTDNPPPVVPFRVLMDPELRGWWS